MRSGAGSARTPWLAIHYIHGECMHASDSHTSTSVH